MEIHVTWPCARELIHLHAKGHKIQAIKRVRHNSYLGLKAAKETVEALVDGNFAMDTDHHGRFAIIELDFTPARILINFPITLPTPG